MKIGVLSERFRFIIFYQKQVPMNKLYGVIICVFFALLSCNHTSQCIAEPDVSIPSVFIEEVKPNPVEEPVTIPVNNEEPFDPSSISQEVFDTTKSEVQVLIEQLNLIIRKKDYNTWITYLGQNYLDAISDPGFLKRISIAARLAERKITLEGPEDYFLHVVVPSRANDHVDDIEFIGENQVKAFTITSKGQKLRLYNLEKTENTWKIIE
jgi:hypothetical protein